MGKINGVDLKDLVRRAESAPAPDAAMLSELQTAQQKIMGAFTVTPGMGQIRIDGYDPEIVFPRLIARHTP